MMLRSSSSNALFFFALLATSAVACSSRVPVGTEGDSDDEIRRKSKKDAAAPSGPTTPQNDGGAEASTPAPTTCAELPAGQCNRIPGCRECGPNELCATPCIKVVAQDC